MYTLDTNAILYYLKDDPHTVSSLRKIFTQNVPLYVSAITELELFAFSNLSATEEAVIEELLTTVAVFAVDSHIARLAAFIRRQYRLKLPDSSIAATAMFTVSTLLTRNTRGFQRVPRLSLLNV